MRRFGWITPDYCARFAKRLQGDVKMRLDQAERGTRSKDEYQLCAEVKDGGVQAGEEAFR